MPKAAEVAVELRKLADLFDTQPEAEVSKPHFGIYCFSREEFLGAVPFMPKPYTKDVRYSNFHIEHKTSALDVDYQASQSMTCTLVTPAQEAVYDCLPLLSLEDEANLGTADGVPRAE